jgi:hypothetical protein
MTRVGFVKHFWTPANDVCDMPEAQAIFCRRRHQPRRPPLAKIRPGLGQRDYGV